MLENKLRELIEKYEKKLAFIKGKTSMLPEGVSFSNPDYAKGRSMIRHELVLTDIINDLKQLVNS